MGIGFLGDLTDTLSVKSHCTHNNLEDSMFKIRALATALMLVGSISIASAWDALPTTAPAPADNPTTAEKV